MKHATLVAAAVLALAAPGRAQESWNALPAPERLFAELDAAPDPDPAAVAILSKPLLGIRAGLFIPRGADDPGYSAGVHAILPLGSQLSVEASLEATFSEFEDGDVEVLTYPLQLTAFLNVLELPKISPYVLGGVGFHFTTVDFSGGLSSVDDDSEFTLGVHLGFGARFDLTGTMFLDANLRYIFMRPDFDQVDEEDFDTVQLTMALSFVF